MPLYISKLVLALQDHGVVAVREIADDHRGGINSAGSRNRQSVHVRHRYGVECASRVLIDQFNVIVELLDFDRDAVLVGPFFHDTGIGGIAPRHPADIDGPRNFEILLLGGLAGIAANPTAATMARIPCKRLDKVPIIESPFRWPHQLRDR